MNTHVISTENTCIDLVAGICNRQLSKYRKYLRCFKTLNPAKYARVLKMASVSGTVQYSFPCRLRGFHVYKEIWKPKVGDGLSCIHERNNQHDWYGIAVTKLLPRQLLNGTLGHLPCEISRFTRFLISRDADVFVTVKDAHFRHCHSWRFL